MNGYDLLKIILGILTFLAMLGFLIYNRAKYTSKIKNLVYRDSLTGGYNFEAFKTYYEKKDKTKGYVVAMDIDNYFSIQNVLGSEAADRIIKGVWKVVDDFLLNEDIYCRVSGDNFAFYLEPRNAGDLEWSMSNLLNKIGDYAKNNQLPSLEVVFGVYKCKETDTAQMSYLKAKYALKKLDHASRRFVYFYESADEFSQMVEDKVIHGFKKALANGELKVDYQPKFDMKTGRMTGAESLVRWYTNEGILYPKDILKSLEKNGYIYQLDSYVFEEVVKFQARRLKKGLKILPISVNISHRSLYYGNVVDEYRTLLHSYRVDSRYVPLEISDIDLNEDSRIIEVTKRFSHYDFSLHIANYGAGNASIAAISEMDFDTIKIDRKLISNIEDIRTRKVVANIISMVKDLHKKVIAVGVENRNQSDLLKILRVDEIQGFYYSKPMNETAYSELLERYINEPLVEQRQFSVIKRDSITSSYNLSNVSDEMLSLMIGTSGVLTQADDGIYISSANENMIKALKIDCGSKEKLNHFLPIEDYLYQKDMSVLLKMLSQAKDNKYATGLLRFIQEKGSLYTDAKIFFKGEFNSNYEYFIFLTANTSDKSEHEIISNLPLGTFVFRADTEVILEINDELLELLGYSSFNEYRQERGNLVENLVLKDDYDVVKYNLKRQVHGVNNMEKTSYHIVKRDGSLLLVNDTGKLVFDEEKGYMFYNIVIPSENIDKDLENVDLEHLEYSSTHDGLTGLINQAAADNNAQEILDSHPDFDFAMLIIDIDDFKLVNDEFGHSVGDKVIEEFGKRINKVTNNNGVCARIGGDEFLILEPLVLEDETMVVRRVYKELHFTLEGAVVTPSIGVSSTKTSERNYSDLFLNADRALYYTKNNGKDGYNIYEHGMLASGLNTEELMKREDVTFDSIIDTIDALDELSENYMFVMDIKKSLLYNSKKSLGDFNFMGNDILDARTKMDEVVFADDKEILYQEIAKIRAGEKHGHDFVYRWLDKNRNPVWVRCRGKVIEIDGKPRYLIGVVSKVKR